MCLNTLEPDLIIWFESGAYWKGWWMDEFMDEWIMMGERETIFCWGSSCNGTSLVNSFFTFPFISILIHPILAYYCGKNQVSEQLFTLITYLLAFIYRLWWT
jgi:hypothetical protein